MTTSEDCARVILEVVPLVMRTIRSELRTHRTSDLSVPQFRILSFINRSNDPSLSDLAEHIGLTLPTMSKMVDGLVARQWVTRHPCADDRRRMMLGLTKRGKDMYEQAIEQTHAQLAKRFEGLSLEERTNIVEAMGALQSVFANTQREVKTR